nr:MAG TPA: hypothetical protein [Bacteriophage sp.]
MDDYILDTIFNSFLYNTLTITIYCSRFIILFHIIYCLSQNSYPVC